jgi:hypothetical protein
MSATSLHLGATLFAFYVVALSILIVWVFLEMDINKVYAVATHSSMMKQVVVMARSDWMKAIAVAGLGGPIFTLLAIDYLTNAVRKCRGSSKACVDDRFTPLGQSFIHRVESWPWSSILIKVNILAELFFTLQVGVAKITYIFLSWLNSILEDAGFLTVCILVYLIGGSMFLLPPVPGLPVYVFAGILLGGKGSQEENIGFGVGIAIAVVLGLFTKLCACVGQYMLGFYLGKSIKVQQLIGVDKVPTRAIEQILKSRGLNAGKVALLVGGPDWPTSVTCGIVRVNIPQMLLGTLPVLVLLAPCCAAGAFMGRVKPGEESLDNMLANAFTASAATVNMVSMAYAVYTISITVQHHGDELARPRPEHEAVAELTRREQAAVEAYEKTVDWNTLSLFWRSVLLSSAVGMVMANGAMVALAAACFEPFSVSSDIDASLDEGGLGGNPLKIVIWPYGVLALALFFFALVLHIVFVMFMKRRAAARLISVS